MWHTSGANTTLDQHRMELNLAYIPFWLNHTAGGWPPVHPETFQRMPRLLQVLNQHRVTVPFIISGVDANGDEQVYIFDLVLVASQFGRSGADLSGDVNSDGVVNIFDLVAITGAFGQSNLGVELGIWGNLQLPSLQQLTTLQKHYIATTIERLGSKPDPSQAEVIALEVL